MSYVNTGASVAGTRVKTKRQLKELMQSAPASVYFDCTSLFDQGKGYQGDALPSGVILAVVLPDPYKDRRAYANVSLKSDGSVRVL